MQHKITSIQRSSQKKRKDRPVAKGNQRQNEAQTNAHTPHKASPPNTHTHTHRQAHTQRHNTVLHSMSSECYLPQGRSNSQCSPALSSLHVRPMTIQPNPSLRSPHSRRVCSQQGESVCVCVCVFVFE